MKRKPLNKISDKKKAQLERELPIKIAILKRAGGKCEVCGRSGQYGLYPLSTHHKGVGADRRELKSVDDGECLCILCHAKRHGINAKLSQPKWGNGDKVE